MKTQFLAAVVMTAVLAICPSYADAAGPQEADSNEKSEQQSKPAPRVVTIIGSTKLNVRQWPLLGKPTARHIFVEMFDYTCPHCQSLQKSIAAAFKKHGDDLAVVTLAVPLNASCNKQVGVTESQHREACDLARLAIAVWRLKPEKYREYHDWLFEETRTAAAARRQALKLVPEAELNEQLAKRNPDKYLSRHVKLYELAGSGSVPKCLFPGVTLTGDVGSTELLQTIEQQSCGK